MIGSKIFWTKFFLDAKFFQTNIFLTQRFFWKIFSDPKYFLDPKFFLKIFLTQNLLRLSKLSTLDSSLVLTSIASQDGNSVLVIYGTRYLDTSFAYVILGYSFIWQCGHSIWRRLWQKFLKTKNDFWTTGNVVKTKTQPQLTYKLQYDITTTQELYSSSSEITRQCKL